MIQNKFELCYMFSTTEAQLTQQLEVKDFNYFFWGG